MVVDDEFAIADEGEASIIGIVRSIEHQTETRSEVRGLSLEGVAWLDE